MPGFVGPQTRATADGLEAQRLANVAAQIRPGVTVQIERTRPTWCAGFLEDYPIDEQSDSFAELRAYIRDNYGGARYRLTVMNSQGVVLADGSFPVAAAPKDRGRPIDRLVWEGDTNPAARAPAQQAASSAPASPVQASADQGLALALLQILRDSNNSTVQAVKEMTQQTREQTKDLVEAVVKTRSEERRERTLASQLEEVVGVTRAVDKVQRQLFGSAARKPSPGDLDEAADREATTFFKKAVIGKIFGPDQQQRQRVQIPDAGAPTTANGKGGN